MSRRYRHSRRLKRLVAMIEQPTRRGFITGLGALLIAAPAIVRATSIMPVHHFDYLGPLTDEIVLNNGEWIGLNFNNEGLEK